MKHKERRLYQKNREGFLLILCFIILNIIYSIFTLNTMDKNYYLGSFVMMTILLLLLGFLTAVKVQTYSRGWSIVAVGTGIIQFFRIFFVKTLAEGNMLFFLNLVLIISALFCVAGGILSFKNALERDHMEEKERTHG